MIVGVIGFAPAGYAEQLLEKPDHVFKALGDLSASYINGVTGVCSGGARGVEHYVAIWATLQKLPLTVVPPNYKNARSQVEAFTQRNQEIVSKSNKVIVFWDGTSKMMLTILQHASTEKKPVLILPPDFSTTGQ